MRRVDYTVDIADAETGTPIGSLLYRSSTDRAPREGELVEVGGLGRTAVVALTQPLDRGSTTAYLGYRSITRADLESLKQTGWQLVIECL